MVRRPRSGSPEGRSMTQRRRSALTRARGKIAARVMNRVMPTTIWLRYPVKAVRPPMVNRPSSMSRAPNRLVTVVAMLATSRTPGRSITWIAPTRRARPVRSRLADSNRSLAVRSRRNARITRVPLSCSRSTRFTVSTAACSLAANGVTKVTKSPTPTPSTTAATTITGANVTDACSDRTTAPTVMIGAVTATLVTRKIACATTAVSREVRVSIVGVPNSW